MILSMTGFGRGTAVLNGREITVELRSVNSRYFEYSSRIPRSCSYMDSRLKKQLNERVTRGKVELSMTIGLFFLFCISNWAICTLSSGEGRFDIQLEPKDKSQLGYIIEFKAGKNLSDTELANSASSAIQQIQSKKYSTDMEYHGIKKIGLFGIAFSGKRVAAKYAEIQLHS